MNGPCGLDFTALRLISGFQMLPLWRSDAKFASLRLFCLINLALKLLMGMRLCRLSVAETAPLLARRVVNE